MEIKFSYPSHHISPEEAKRIGGEGAMEGLELSNMDKNSAFRPELSWEVRRPPLRERDSISEYKEEHSAHAHW